MIKAEKLQSGKYRARATYYTPDGKQHSKSFTDKTPAKAVAAAEKFKEEKKFENLPENRPLSEIVDEYIKMKTPILSPSTIEGYRVIYRNYFQNLLKLPVCKITTAEIQKAINDEYMNGRSAKTVKNSYGLITSALSEICDIRFSKKIALPKREKHIKQIPSAEIIPQIVQAAEGTIAEIPVIIAITCGLRMSEIRGLKWEDYDGKSLYIHRVKLYVDRKNVVKNLTKSDAGTRIVEIPSIVSEKLNKMSIGKTNDEYIINATHQTIYKAFQRALKKNNIEPMSFHFLRHINASIMMSLNIPERYAMQRNGWSSDYIYKNIYTHTISKEMHEANRQINDKFDSLIQGNNATNNATTF